MPNTKIQTHKYLYSLVLNQWPLSVLNSPNFDFPNKPTGMQSVAKLRLDSTSTGAWEEEDAERKEKR